MALTPEQKPLLTAVDEGPGYNRLVRNRQLDFRFSRQAFAATAEFAFAAVAG
jgi:hypothetical protein